ncbi:unnamed protein product [Thelazia callipaeda]|uniref:USP domain-containing protein n=1 Tax=Thelazia callipaeda TaxID=103827 RepID=A0A158RCD3_THECL|nr:unnamed protein product [Thelazia callipaeda]
MLTLAKSSGFVNFEGLSYIYTMLQCLFANWIFVDDLYTFCMDLEECGCALDEDLPLSSAIARLGSQYPPVTSRLRMKLLEVVKKTLHVIKKGQWNICEFLLHILTQMQDECDRILIKHGQMKTNKKEHGKNPVRANFTFIVESITKCQKCWSVVKKVEDNVYLPISIQFLKQAKLRSAKFSNRFTLQLLLNEYFKTADIIKKCNYCGFMRAQISQRIIQIPRCLVIFINRYFYEYDAKKAEDKVAISLYITLGDGYAKNSDFSCKSPVVKKINFESVRPLHRKIFSSFMQNSGRIFDGASGDISISVFEKKSQSFSSLEYDKEENIFSLKKLQKNWDNEDVENMDDDEIFNVYGYQPVSYKPVSQMRRNEICTQIGIQFRRDWMQVTYSDIIFMEVYTLWRKSSISSMNLHDQPESVINLEGKHSTLFQALTYYLSGDVYDFRKLRQCIIRSEISNIEVLLKMKNWNDLEWNIHMADLMENKNSDFDIELYIFASMFNVDVWLYRNKRWVCYRPKWLIIDNKCKEQSIHDYKIGENEGIYLNYENGNFLPVYEPMEFSTEPLYELLSLVSDHGQRMDSGEC